MFYSHAVYNINYAGGYVFIRSDQIIGGTKIFLTLDDVTTSVINEILFVYQLNGSMSLTLQTSSQHTVWSSSGAAASMGIWQRVRLFAESLPNDSPVNLQFVATGSSGFAAVDDLTVQVQSHCNYESLSNPGEHL